MSGNYKSTVEENKGTGHIIEHLKDEVDYNRVLSDDTGEFALVTDEAVVVGKKYVWKGTTVSCHKRAVVAALNMDKKLTMYILDQQEYYHFHPLKILQEGEVNMKGSAKMLNFPIKHGIKMDLGFTTLGGFK